MQGQFVSSVDAMSGRRRAPTAAFSAECGLHGPLRFIVENTETGQSQTFDVFEPFVLIGRSPGCHLQLMHPEVCYRHAYCQVIDGRLYVFDLDSEHGTMWGTGLRHEGVLTPETRLQIGPFALRLSRAPAFTRSLEPTAEDWTLENEPLENVRLWFENAAGRSSHSALRPLRRRITILGRSNRSHLKLSDPSVSKAHCAIVRTGVGFWVVDLLGRTGTSLNDRPIRFAPIGAADRIGVGRFRLRIREVVPSDADDVRPARDARRIASDSSEILPATPLPAPMTAASPPAGEAAAREHLLQARTQLAMHASRLPADSLDALPGASDALILAMMEQFSHLQQQLLTHTQQQMSMLTEMFATLHKAQNDAVMEQLSRIQAITSELNALRAGACSGEGQGPAPGLAPSELALGSSAAAAGPQAESRTTAAGVDAALPPAGAQLADSSAEFATADESDVVAVMPGAVPADQECDLGDQGPPAVEPMEADAIAEPVRPTGTASASRQRQPLPRVDQDAHARITMRISELERERNSRWRRLMQIVGGTTDD